MSDQNVSFIQPGVQKKPKTYGLQIKWDRILNKGHCATEFKRCTYTSVQASEIDPVQLMLHYVITLSFGTVVPEQTVYTQTRRH